MNELNIRTLDHADIVGPIPNGQCDSLLVFLNQLNHLGLLQRGDPAANHSLTHTRCPQQLQLQVLLQCKGLRRKGKKGLQVGSQAIHTQLCPLKDFSTDTKKTTMSGINSSEEMIYHLFQYLFFLLSQRQLNLNVLSLKIFPRPKDMQINKLCSDFKLA